MWKIKVYPRNENENKMSSSLSELRNFRLNKAQNANGTPSKLATGRKRIRAMSDSSDDEHTKKTASPQKPTQNGTATLSVKEREERFLLFRETIDKSVDSLILQDYLSQNDWNVQKAYDALQENPKYASGKHSSPATSVQSTNVTSSRSPSTHVKVQNKQNKVKSIESHATMMRSHALHKLFTILLFFLNSALNFNRRSGV